MFGQDSRMALHVAAVARLVEVLKPVSDGLPHPERWAILWPEGQVARVG